jgi:WD40 repeat protein
MYCPKCGTQNQEGFAFCTHCGAKLPVAFNQPSPIKSSPIHRILWIIPVIAVCIVVVVIFTLAMLKGRSPVFQLTLRPTSLPENLLETTPAKQITSMPGNFVEATPITQTTSLPGKFLQTTPTTLTKFPGSPLGGSDPIILENVSRLQQLTRWGKGSINDIAYSPDGRLLEVATSIGIYLNDIQTFDQVRFIESPEEIASAVFTPDGQFLVSGVGESTIKVWRVSDGSLARTFIEDKNSVEKLVISPDGSLLAGGSNNNVIRLMQVSDGSLARTLEGHKGLVSTVAFSPDGQLLASGSADKTIKVWRVSDGTLLKTLEGHTNWIPQVVFSPDGQLLASSSIDGTVTIWRVNDGSLVHTQTVSRYGVESLSFSPDGQLLVTAASDTGIKLWRISDGSLVNTFAENNGYFLRVIVSPDGQSLISSSDINGIEKVNFWRITGGKPIYTLDGFMHPVSGVAFSPDSRLLVSESIDGSMNLWNTDNGSLARTLQRFEGSVSKLAFSPDWQLLAGSSTDRTVKLWRLSDGSPDRTLEGQADRLEGVVTFSRDGRLLAAGSGDGSLRVWRVSDGRLIQTMHGTTKYVVDVVFSPDGLLLASASEDVKVKLWRVNDGNLLYTLDGQVLPRFSPDGHLLVCESFPDGKVKFWRVSDGGLVRTIEGHPPYYVRTIVFSPDGRLLVSGSDGPIIKLWRVNDGILVKTLEGHTSGISEVAFSSDGKLLASGSQDGTIRLWGIAPQNTTAPPNLPSLAMAPYPTDTPAFIPTPTASFSEIPGSINILWMDNCDPRKDASNCQEGPSEIFKEFYDTLAKLNANIEYRLPQSLPDLKKYDVVIANFCRAYSDDNANNILKEYVSAGGSVIVMADEFCRYGSSMSTGQYANQFTQGYGITFTKDDDIKTPRSGLIANHPLTMNVERIFALRHAYLTISAPSSTLVSINGKPFIGLYDQTGTVIAIPDVGFHWGTAFRQEISQSDNFIFWQNMVTWLAQQSREKLSR